MKITVYHLVEHNKTPQQTQNLEVHLAEWHSVVTTFSGLDSLAKCVVDYEGLFGGCQVVIC